MKIFNRYTYLFLGLLVIAAFVLINFIPNLETEEFDQQVIDNIIEGVTTTTEPTQNQDVVSSEQTTENIENEENIIITEEDLPKIGDLLKYNEVDKEITNFDAYLLIGSDERSVEIAQTRGSIQGKRADVIILGLVEKGTDEITLLSFPRDLLIQNSCTNNLERINAAIYQKMSVVEGAENLAASIFSISGIRVDHFASFDFEGFEDINRLS